MMNDAFFKPTFSGLYTIQYLLRSAKASCAKTAVRHNGPAPKRQRQTGRAKPAAPKRHVPYIFNCFLKAGRVLVSRIVAGRLFQVRGPATSKARSPVLVLVVGTKTSDEFDDRSRDLLQSSDSGLILSAK